MTQPANLIMPTRVADESQKAIQANVRSLPGALVARGLAALTAPKSDADSMYRRGEGHFFGRDGHPQNDEEAFRWYLQAAELGHAAAQANVGSMYKCGKGIETDFKRGRDWDSRAAASYRSSAENGDAEARSCLGEMYWQGRGVKQDLVQAVFWLRQAAEQGHAYAQTNLAQMLLRGLGSPRDEKLSLHWFLQAAQQGNALAQGRVAVSYAIGDLFPKDLERAAFWSRQEAEQSDAATQFLLSVQFEEGDGVPQDDEEAVYWLRRSLEQDHTKAENERKTALRWSHETASERQRELAMSLMFPQYLLGARYADGRGVPKDISQAFVWYRKAAANGYLPAQQAMRQLERKLRADGTSAEPDVASKKPEQ